MEHHRVTDQHNSQEQSHCLEELQAELARSHSLLSIQSQELGECRDEIDELQSSLIDIKNAHVVARREADGNARAIENFRSQCFLLQNQLQKAAAARRKAGSSLFRAAQPNSIAEITRREITAQQTVERLLVELKSTRLVCRNLKRNTGIYQEHIERLESESQSRAFSHNL